MGFFFKDKPKINHKAAEIVINIISNHILEVGGLQNMSSKRTDDYSIGYIAGMVDASYITVGKLDSAYTNDKGVKFEAYLMTLDYVLRSIFGSVSPEILNRSMYLIENRNFFYNKAIIDGGIDFMEFISSQNAFPYSWQNYVMGYGDEEVEPNIPTKEVIIGSQVWMAENLNVDRFRNGDPIPEMRTADEWRLAGVNRQPAWCHMKNDPSNGESFGKLYNWYAVVDKRGIGPIGWHVPSDAEWTVLSDFLGLDAGHKMKWKKGWIKDNIGLNSSGFTGLLGGFRYSDGAFSYVGMGCSFWSCTQSSIDNACSRGLNDGNSILTKDNYFSKGNGFSVRCIKP